MRGVWREPPIMIEPRKLNFFLIMLALNELYKKVSSDMFIMKWEVVNGIDALQEPDWTTKDCAMTNGMRAVHFSHKAMDLGKQVYRGAIHRATVARQFLNMWHRVCEYTPVANG